MSVDRLLESLKGRWIGLILLAAGIFGIAATLKSVTPNAPWYFGAWVLVTASGGYNAISRSLNPLRLALGADNRYSLSKLQFFLWTLAIGFAVGALLRKIGFGQPIDFDRGLVIALGLSSLTAISAKVVTSRQVETNTVAKPTGTPSFAQFLLDDSDRPDLTKFQMFFWTIVAIVAFLGQLNPDLKALPRIDDLFLVLMGLADGTYVGTKLVATSTPRITAVVPGEVLPGMTAKLTGAAFGTSQGGSQILFNGTPSTAAVATWTDTAIDFVVPASLAGSVRIELAVGGRLSNSVQLSVVSPVVSGLNKTSGKPGDQILIQGSSFGETVADIEVFVGATSVVPTQVARLTIAFTIPQVTPGTYSVQVKRKIGTSSQLSGSLPLEVTA